MKELRPLAVALSLLLSALSPTPAQQPRGQRPPADDDDEAVARITTNLVQLDAVVLDKDGRQVSDLTAEDFEVSEDGRPQKVTNFSYVLNAEGAPAAPKSKPDAGTPPAPPVKLRPRDVRRTFALVVDDLQLSFESIYYTRRALKKFIDEVMQPGDLVAIIRVGGGVGALQQFTADKNILSQAVEHVRYNMRANRLTGSFEAVAGREFAGASRSPNGGAASGNGVRPSGIGGAASGDRGGAVANVGVNEPDDYDDFIEESGAVGSLGAVRYVLKGMRELPGRKAVLLFSEGFQLYRPDAGAGRNARVRDEFHQMIDAATRSSTVIYPMDPRGLAVTGFTAAEDLSGPGTDPRAMGEELMARDALVFEKQATLRDIARETGGFALVNNNDLSGGVRRVMEAERGYYLIGYRPSGDTFDRRFHNISVKVKRAGVRVLSRRGFYGVTDEDRHTKPRKPGEQLLAALTSPFGASGVEVELTPLFTSDVSAGPYIRSLIHVNASDLSFKDEPDGWHLATLDVLGAAFDDRGLVVQQNGVTQQVRLRGRTYERVLRDGLVYTFNVPLKQAGAYQLRFAVRDAASARVGSASQYVEVPNLKKGRLALSGLYMNGAFEAPGRVTTEAPGEVTKDAPGRVTTPAAADVDLKSGGAQGQTRPEEDVLAGPAVRRLRPGMTLGYAYLIYNAKLDKATGRPQLVSQTRVFREGKLVYDGAEQPIDIGGVTEFRRIAVGGGLKLGEAFAPGEYALQVIVYDRLRQDKHPFATQSIDFEVVK
jgi:VWFA-related protein